MSGWMRWISATRPSASVKTTASLLFTSRAPSTRPLDSSSSKRSRSHRTRWRRSATTVRGQAGVGHDEVIPGVVPHPLHAGVFEAEALFRDSEDVSELVLEAIDRGEDHDVGHVVHEPRATLFAQAVSLADGPHEQVVAPLVVNEAGIEERAVARERAGFQDRPGRQAAHAAQAVTSCCPCDPPRRSPDALGRPPYRVPS